MHGGASLLFPGPGFHMKIALDSKAFVHSSLPVLPWGATPLTFRVLHEVGPESYHQNFYAVGIAASEPGSEVIRVLQPALEKLSVDVEVCRGVSFRGGNPAHGEI